MPRESLHVVQPTVLRSTAKPLIKLFSFWQGIKRSFSPMFFVIKDQLPPAGLVRILLLIAGIEPNPGPIPGWICSLCNQQINERTQTLVKCNKCNNWFHLRKNKETNCSQLKWSCSQSNKTFFLCYRRLFPFFCW